jgi:lipopolysaccharide/colanic/teichoic acid biosynthesis glycosyltransferase
MSTIYAQNLFARTLNRFAPALVGAFVTLLRSDVFGEASLVFLAILFADYVLRGGRYPLHLVPLAHYMLNFIVPFGGVALAYAIGQLGSPSIGEMTALAAALTATVAAMAAMWLGVRFANDRPIRTVVIGDGGFASRLAAELRENRIRSYQLLGYVDGDSDDASGMTRLGDLSQIRSVVIDNRIDLLVVSPDKPRLQIFEETAKACLDLPVRMIEATALYESVLGHVPIGAINSAWFQFIMHPLYSPSSPLSKRLLDIVVSSGLALATAPLMITCALAVKLEDRGPIFYRQRRFGEEGREFDMIKFRTLRPDADELLAQGKSEEEVLTRAGRILRKGHLNELPQLLQVLRGEMSLVGPRPEPPELVQMLSGLVPHYDRRGLVKPGLTGWAQVRCGYASSRIGTAWKTCHDLYYVKHRSARFDLLILLQTFHALVEREEIEQVPAPDFILGDAAELIAR